MSHVTYAKWPVHASPWVLLEEVYGHVIGRKEWLWKDYLNSTLYETTFGPKAPSKNRTSAFESYKCVHWPWRARLQSGHIYHCHALSYQLLKLYYFQSWALALFSRFALRSIFFYMDRYNSIAHFPDFQVCSLLNRSQKKQWFALIKEC